MAVELLNTIPDVAWSKNPIRVHLKSDSLIEDPGKLSVLFFNFAWTSSPNFVGPIQDETMTFSFYGLEEVFVFKNSPIIGNNELPTYNSSITIGQWFEDLRNHLISNNSINRYYTIDVTPVITYENGSTATIVGSNHYLKFTSKERSSQANLYIYVAMSVDFDRTRVSDGKPIYYRKNLKIFVELWIYSDSSAKKIIAVSLPTDSNGESLFDLSNLLHNCAQANLRNENIDSGVVKYYIVYTDVYGDNQVVGNLIQGADKHVLYGGVPRSREGETVIDSLVQNSLLRWLNPSNSCTDEVVIGQEYQLTLFNPGNILISVNVVAMMHYENDVDYELVLDTISIPAKSKVYVDALDARIFEAYPEDKLLSWDIYLKDDEAEISERYRLELIEHPSPYIRHVKYLNSYGSWSYMNLYGRAKQSYSIDRESVDIMTSSGKSMRKDLNLSARQNRLLRSGYRSKEVIQQYMDLILSENVLLLEDNIWEPITLNNSEILESEDGNHLYSVELEVSFASEEYQWGYK